MRKHLSCLLAALCLPFLLFAQADTTEYKGRADYYMTNLDKSQIPTGIRYDRVFPLAGL